MCIGSTETFSKEDRRQVYLHRPDALLVKVLFNLGVVNPVNTDGPPLLDELLVDVEVGGVIVEKQDLLFITRPGYLLVQVMHKLLAEKSAS